MKIHFSITWGKTQLYNEGNRDLVIPWKPGEGFPREGEAINIPNFINGKYKSNETFIHNDREWNVFDWVENTIGWEVEMVKWDYKDGKTFLHILIGDKG